MTKGAVKAMDTVTNFLTSDTAPAEIQALGLNPSKYFVAGASKRGWTTWTTAAVDPRVIGIMPVVMDELNFVENIKHHYRSYGGWSFALEDYWVLNLTKYFNDPKMQQMCDSSTPFSVSHEFCQFQSNLFSYTHGNNFQLAISAFQSLPSF